MQQADTYTEVEQRRQEARVRALANRRGHHVVKSRAQRSLDQHGEYMLMENSRNIPVLGFKFDATLDEIEAYFE